MLKRRRLENKDTHDVADGAGNMADGGYKGYGDGCTEGRGLSTFEDAKSRDNLYEFYYRETIYGEYIDTDFGEVTICII